jgi:hypothetical protein
VFFDIAVEKRQAGRWESAGATSAMTDKSANGGSPGATRALSFPIDPGPLQSRSTGGFPVRVPDGQGLAGGIGKYR